LQDLSAKELVAELARRPGQKEVRWAHLLAGPPATEPSELETRAPLSDRNTRDDERVAALEREVALLKQEVTALRADLDSLLRQLQ
jgi:hypothetical protein